MNLWITGQSQNKWGMVSTVNEQKEHKFESIKPILLVIGKVSSRSLQNVPNCNIHKMQL